MTLPIFGSKRAPGIPDGRPAVETGATSSNSAATDLLRILARHGIGPDERMYLHHVAGRLRLRGDVLKEHPARLDRICRNLAALPGVRSATANSVTRSIVIYYDPLVLPPDAVRRTLQQCGVTMDEGGGAGVPGWAEQVSAKALEFLLERLALALIAAVV